MKKHIHSIKSDDSNASLFLTLFPQGLNKKANEVMTMKCKWHVKLKETSKTQEIYSFLVTYHNSGVTAMSRNLVDSWSSP